MILLSRQKRLIGTTTPSKKLPFALWKLAPLTALCSAPEAQVSTESEGYNACMIVEKK
jgi:hypothetical protein